MNAKLTGSVSDLLQGLDDQQRAAVVAPPGPVCVLAGAGTGKTRTITHRIAHLVRTDTYPANQILAVTFTTKAAGEMRARLARLGAAGVQAQTFHAAALRQLRFFWPRAVGGQMWPVVERKLQLVRQAAQHVGINTDTVTLRDLAAEIEWAKASLITPADYGAQSARFQRTPPVSTELVATAYSTYEQVKTAAAVLDFDDLLLQVCAVLADDEEAARQFRGQYRCFVVDEYQDVTPLQQQLIDTWLGGRDELTVVGDANQTIYSFAGASPKYLINFERKYSHATVVRLQRDYRSTPQVIAVANQVMAASRELPANMRLALQPVLPDGPPVMFAEHPDEPTEAAAVAQQIKKLIDSGAPASSIAVLYRMNAQSQSYERALVEANISYAIRGGQEFFSRPEIRRALHVLEKAAHTAEGSSGDSGTELLPLLRQLLEPLGLTATVPATGAVRDRWEGLSALVAVAEELLAAQSDADLTTLVGELSRRNHQQNSPAIEAVTLASLHAAKGLEWNSVFLVGLTDGVMPIQHAKSDPQIEEERRLLYVGITRARQQLTMSWALSRHAGGRKSRNASRFLRGIAPAVPAAPSRHTSSRRKPGRCRHCGGPLIAASERKVGRCSQCPSTADPALVSALKKWRKECAAESAVPAFVVFSDATLTAIAEMRPADSAALLRVPGVGPTKLERYGSEVLGLIASIR